MDILETLYQGFVTDRRIAASIKGKRRLYELVDIKGAVAAIVVDARGFIGLVYQFRPAADQFTFEIPAGTIDNEKGPREILIDEIGEELSINPKTDIVYMTQDPILSYYMMVGVSNGKSDIYYARVTAQHNLEHVDDQDIIGTKWVDIDTLGKLIREKLVVDEKTILAYLYLKSHPELILPK